MEGGGGESGDATGEGLAGDMLRAGDKGGECVVVVVVGTGQSVARVLGGDSGGAEVDVRSRAARELSSSWGWASVLSQSFSSSEGVKKRRIHVNMS